MRKLLLIGILIFFASCGRNKSSEQSSEPTENVGGWEASEIIPPPEESISDPDLIGRWEYSSGSYIYFFERNGDIEFFSDGRVVQYINNDNGTFTVLEYDRLSVSAGDDIFFFAYEIKRNTLTLTDHDGDRAVFRRS